ncbi:MAG: DHH family phosphoesterase, partial [Rhodocyclaceae bacterium]|nr:DHH family phosphoesterase [Rhodocyclaceae bacterium]
MQITARRANTRAVETLTAHGAHPLLARLYAARGVRHAQELDERLSALLPPDALLGADAAARLLADAIAAQTRILIVADYDCDGATACAIALRALRAMGAQHLDYIVPDRQRHGYGLSPAIVELAAARQPGLLITVDNGIASFEGIAQARSRGIATLITDHHLPADTLPEADVIVNPNQP